MKQSSSIVLPIAILFAGILIAAGITIAHAQTNPASVSFPVAELGNCANEAACRTYCDDMSHLDVCVTFGEAHGLISKEDAARAREFKDVVKTGGPGGCRDENTCKNYCADLSHIDECVTFAERHNILSKEDLSEARKMAVALKNGAKLPGGCTSKDSCETYCADTSHVDECLAFAEQSGIISPEEIAQARKVLPLIRNGESPGQCKTKDECEKYCADSSHFNECISFAEKAGLLSEEELSAAKKSGGKGPGGCASKDSCEAYCNDSNHAEECFNFAKEHGILSENQLKEIQDGMGRLRMGLSSAPGEVVQCLKSNLGENIVGQIESGKLVPTQKIGEQVKSCFDSYMPKLKEGIRSMLKDASPEVLSCLKNGLGDEGLKSVENGEAPTPQMGDTMRGCFKTMQEEGLKQLRSSIGKMPPEMKQCIMDAVGSDTFAKIQNGEDVELGADTGAAIKKCATSATQQIRTQLQTNMQQVPESARECVKEKLGSNFEEKLQKGEVAPGQISAAVQECVKSMMPQGVGGMGIQGVPRNTGGPVPAPSQGMPTGDTACAAFQSAPSCDVVPPQMKDMCERCKGK